ncbi:hypothetical protein PVBG_06359 [Plasmodium vivax Brazil I]|uniref:Uncharacterized protein n=1 Tax=Plasmodium vivax (strain Brazil I) TaxID=1033975 RepID=A0A0J9SPS6_PLAV1|nr:hypothetical protein PVBG_06359 [Plasmodium vivax Brazil I]
MAKPLTKKDIDNLTSKFWYSNFDRGENGCEGVPFYSAIKDELEGAHYQNYHLSRISNDIEI